MATQHQRSLARLMVAPSVILLFAWMIVPLAMTLWFSFQRYNLLDPTQTGFAGFINYTYFLGDPGFWTALWNTLLLVGGVLAVTVAGGIALALLGGFVLAAAALFAATARGFGHRNFLVSFPAGIGVAVFLYILFQRLLGLALPAGPSEAAINALFR